MPEAASRRVRATRLSDRAWGVVLDAGRRADTPSEVWAELEERGMASAGQLTTAWQQVAQGLGAAPIIEVVARQADLRHRTRIGVLGKVAVLATQRLHARGSGMTGEPLVLLQVVPRADVVKALTPHLPPVDELRLDDLSGARTPVSVPVDELGLAGESGALEDGAVDTGPLHVRGEVPGAAGRWMTAKDLRTDPTRESIAPDLERAEQVGEALSAVPEDHVLSEDEVMSLLRGVPGLDPRLVELAGSAEVDVTVTLSPGRAEPTSSAEALGLLMGFALRHWVVTTHGLVCLRVDRGGVEVLGVEPGDLAREIRCLVAGELPEAAGVDSIFGGSA